VAQRPKYRIYYSAEFNETDWYYVYIINSLLSHCKTSVSCNIPKDASVVHTAHTCLNKHGSHSRECNMQECCFDAHILSREILIWTPHHECGKIIYEI
jgi:hypothetical protein